MGAALNSSSRPVRESGSSHSAVLDAAAVPRALFCSPAVMLWEEDEVLLLAVLQGRTDLHGAESWVLEAGVRELSRAPSLGCQP